MSFFKDINQFLEDRLDEFLASNPHLELQALQEQLKEQERDTLKILLEFQQKEKSLQNEILEIADKIKIWHDRVKLAREAGKKDLAQSAEEREAALLRQGNQVWGKMTGFKTRISQTKQLLEKIKERQKEVKTEYDKVKTTYSQSDNNPYTDAWNKGLNSGTKTEIDPLEAEFTSWELDRELEEMKRKMN